MDSISQMLCGLTRWQLEHTRDAAGTPLLVSFYWKAINIAPPKQLRDANRKGFSEKIWRLSSEGVWCERKCKHGSLFSGQEGEASKGWKLKSSTSLQTVQTSRWAKVRFYSPITIHISVGPLGSSSEPEWSKPFSRQLELRGHCAYGQPPPTQTWGRGQSITSNHLNLHAWLVHLLARHKRYVLSTSYWIEITC